MVTYFAIASQAFAIAESVCDNSLFLRIVVAFLCAYKNRY